MDSVRNIDRLSGYVIKLGAVAIIAGLCWYFRSVLVYIILAFVVSMIGRPLMKLLRRVHIRRWRLPDWLLAIITLVLIFVMIFLVVTQVIPVVVGIFRDASIFSKMQLPDGNWIDLINQWVVSVIPGIDPDFDTVGVVLDYLKGMVTKVNITGMIGSVASAVSSIAVGLFATAFISFFFIKDDRLFCKIVGALVPDRLEASVAGAIEDIEELLSRYFVGLLIEMFGIAVVDCLGLWGIVGVNFGYALAIGFFAGVLNIIPYIGPAIGNILGVLLCVVLKYGTGMGLDVNIWIFALIVLAIMLGAQLVDNFLLQPMIYSASIHATPLEIFIVMLIAGHIGGAIGMLAAVPVYMVVRVIAGRFFYDKKPVRRLMPDVKRR